ncbi:MAG: SprT family zinc-dependent metalloprotease [Bifidobacterium scardovii]|uniref:Metal-dependent hydrolase n=2 Tax=Bifidobacterium scardovii TaxID=158787 RepID=A0A087DE00_9BIFI|nr:SprT family zinc-dependent metalloprotease [Bifidobacterium scardovii]KFI93750.1 metal-dependent hydrolase [Bifidobacterium scardovii]MDK6350534.1 SprT family zinc-dependent metalloprotease [Bifidobacterium scardovii]MDU3736666.1 SprT family zinc-dependent metalloprotease [Bifidobacterium scardovii]MDU5297518.1 SprT family zinc-dependent metalloprotease [Bifidobacterium scardovii]MDU5611630.1 SprT family zinc-dependent metalloprotease [Bifidobacterium scardovii]
MTHRPLPRPYDLSIDGLTVTIAHKPIKNLYLRVKPPYGNVEISAPLRMSEERILGFVRERRSWILRQRQRMEDALHRSVDSLQQAGGAPATEENSRGHGQSGSGDRRPLEGPANPAPVFDRSAVWTEERKRQAGEAIDAALPSLLAAWGPVIGRTPTHVTLRLMTSRWGSCTPRTGRIRLNLQLGLMEPRFLEYVLVHEMTHLWVGGHGAEFQRRMSAYLPNWRQLRRELNRRVVL